MKYSPSKHLDWILFSERKDNFLKYKINNFFINISKFYYND
jgi:hypothetical protein